MCFDNNSAHLSNRYFNAQLAALWENAADCYEQDIAKGLDSTSMEQEYSTYTRALMQYHYAEDIKRTIGNDIAPFYAEFNQPRIECICEHAALLSLHIKQGHIDLNKSTSWITDLARKKSLKDIQAVFWVKLSHDTFQLKDSDKFRAVILDMKSAKPLILKREDRELLGLDTGDALEFYLAKYLVFLESTNNHILYDLPHFGAAKSYEPKTDCATSRHRVTREYPVERYPPPADVSIPHVNQWFAQGWKTAKRCLGQTLEIEFGAPHIEPLCSEEVLFIINMPCITLITSNGFKSENVMIKNCEISFIVKPTKEIESNHVTFDFVSPLTRYTVHFPSGEEYQQHIEDIIKHVSEQYSKLLADAAMDKFPCNFVPGLPPPPAYTQVVGLSPSIMKSRISELPSSWYGEHFNATFDISLDPHPAGDTKAWIASFDFRFRFRSGNLIVHRDTGVPENVSLANVEVTHTSRLELKDHEDLPDVERTLQEQRLGEGHRYESSSHTRTKYRHLSLVFHKSEVESTYNSTIATRNAAANASEIDERLRHCTSEYLAAQFNEGNNILCNIPISWDREDQESYIPDHLYFLGMTTPILLLIKIRRTWPMLPGRISNQEIDLLLGSPRDRGRLSGSTSLASKVHLRPLWTYINASTTLIPNSLAVQGDKGQIDFVTWKDWRGTNLEMTNFKHLDWEYDSTLNFDERLKTATVLRVFDQKDKQELSLTSITKNRFKICPSQDSSGLEICCNGKSTMEFRVRRSRTTSEKSSAEWFTTVAIGPDLEVSQTGQNCDIVSRGASGLYPLDFGVRDTHKKLVEAFIHLELEDVQQSLRSLVNNACKAAGAKDTDQRRYSFDNQHNLIVHFYSPA